MTRPSRGCPVPADQLPQENVACARCERLEQEFIETLIIDRDDNLSQVMRTLRAIAPEDSTVRRNNHHILAPKGKGFSPEVQYAPADPLVAPPNVPATVDVVTNLPREVSCGTFQQKGSPESCQSRASGGGEGPVESWIGCQFPQQIWQHFTDANAFKGHVDVTKLLLEREADVNAETPRATLR